MEMKASFRISAGDFSLQAKMDIADRRNGILGASGCGKSMTLKALAGILTPDEGRIELGDRILFDSRAGINVPARERGIGYLFQNYAVDVSVENYNDPADTLTIDESNGEESDAE